MELSARKKLILKTVINDYIRTAEPVGSKALASRPELRFSSATIRNEMSELEEMGYLEKPHTSAGRIPSPAGYRLYVDELMGRTDLSVADVDRINSVMKLKVKELDRMVSEAGKLISNLTDYTTLAVTPYMQRVTIRKFQIIAVSPLDFVIVVVTDSGVVKNKMLRTATPVTAEEAELLTYVLNQTLTNIPIDAITPQRFDIVRRAAGVTALLELVTGYPDEGTGYIGLFMVDARHQSQGEGSRLIGEILAHLKDAGLGYAELCYSYGNQQSEHFWMKNGFIPTGSVRQQGEYYVISLFKKL